jgi:hypothetical protein
VILTSEEPLKQLDALIKATGLPVYRDPRSGALLWVDVRELRLRFALSVNKLKSVEGVKQGGSCTRSAGYATLGTSRRR